MKANDKTVLLVSGKVTFIDLEDVPHLNGGSLTISKYGYVDVSFPLGYRKRKNHRLHRYLLEKSGVVLGDYVVHHRDGNRLNNQKANLAVISQTDNNKGKQGKKDRKKNERWKGYDIHETSYGLTYQARIGVDYKKVQLGTYLTEEDAAVAYDLSAIQYFGKELALLNFPDRNYDGMSLDEWRS